MKCVCTTHSASIGAGVAIALTLVCAHVAHGGRKLTWGAGSGVLPGWQDDTVDDVHSALQANTNRDTQKRL